MCHFQQCFGLKFGYWNLITNDTLLWYPLMLPHTRAQNQRDSKRHVFQWPSKQWCVEMVFTTYLQFKESFEKGLNLDFPVLMSPMDCCNRWGPLNWSILLVTHHSCTYTVNANLSEEFVKYLPKVARCGYPSVWHLLEWAS